MGLPLPAWQVVVSTVCEAYFPRTPTSKEGVDYFTLPSLVLGSFYQFGLQFLFVSTEGTGLWSPRSTLAPTGRAASPSGSVAAVGMGAEDLLHKGSSEIVIS